MNARAYSAGAQRLANRSDGSGLRFAEGPDRRLSVLDSRRGHGPRPHGELVKLVGHVSHVDGRGLEEPCARASSCAELSMWPRLRSSADPSRGDARAQ